MSHFLMFALKLKLCSLDKTYSKLLRCSSVDDLVMIISSILQWTLVIPCSTWSMALYHTARADATPYMSLLKRNNPLCVLIMRYFLWSSSISICRYAIIRSSFVYCSPERFENISFTRGSGYWSTLIHWFNVTLKSPHFELCYPSSAPRLSELPTHCVPLVRGFLCWGVCPIHYPLLVWVSEVQVEPYKILPWHQISVKLWPWCPLMFKGLLWKLIDTFLGGFERFAEVIMYLHNSR